MNEPVTHQHSSAISHHSPFKSAAFHFIPGIAITVAFVVIARLVQPFGWPPSLALLITWLVTGLPTLLGILFFQGKQLNGKYSLDGIVTNRNSMPASQYLWLVPILLIWAALASTLLFPLGEPIRSITFPNWPDWLDPSSLARNLDQYPVSLLWVVVALSAVLNIAVPITEELYFRGFLMSRIPAAPAWKPLISATLFSLYHFWLPWDVLGRIIALLPIVYAVQWKGNVNISILVHCLLNLLGTIGLAVLVMNSGL
jgi:uncharacterized protein